MTLSEHILIAVRGSRFAPLVSRPRSRRAAERRVIRSTRTEGTAVTAVEVSR